MKKKGFRSMCAAVIFLVAFAVWTVLVCLVDVQGIGPNGSSVGFATVNQYVHESIGVRMELYILTDWLGLVPIAIAFGFAAFGLVEWIQRKSIKKVDCNILVLVGFYIVVIAVYLLFEAVTVNYRPVLIDGCLETSYPSSTTLLVLSVMPTAAMQLCRYIQNRICKCCTFCLIVGFIVLMVVGRLLSGVHWITDIFGGILLSVGLVFAYDSARKYFEGRQQVRVETA